MKILDPVLAPDVSIWADHINAKEFEDGGCVSVVVGLYPVVKNGKWSLNPTCRKQCIEVSQNSHMVLQVYMWDDIIQDPIKQANWVVDTIVMEGLPVKFIWGDQEMWWSDWTAYNKWRAGKGPMPARVDPNKISFHNEAFMRQLKLRFPKCGVYTNKNFVISYAKDMDRWLGQYPSWPSHYGRQPNPAKKMTWAELKENWLPDYNIILSAGQKPELVAGHQFTGDRCILPGSYDKYDGLFGHDGRLPLDVSVFSQAFIDSLRTGNDVLPVPPHPAEPAYTNYVVHPLEINTRSEPRSNSNFMGSLYRGDVVKVVNFENDNKWAHLSDGRFVFANYLTPK